MRYVTATSRRTFRWALAVLVLQAAGGLWTGVAADGPVVSVQGAQDDSTPAPLWLAGRGTDEDDGGKGKKKDRKNKQENKNRSKEDDQQGADDKGDKITLCHVPPGNAAAAHTITVGSSAVAAHVAHGDALGPCEHDGSDQRAAIVVFKYLDRNRDGRHGDGEEGLEGWRFRILDGDGERVDQAATNHDGQVRFRLPAGRYRVCEELRDGWVNTEPGTRHRERPCQRVEVAAGERARVRFGNARIGHNQ